MGLVGRTGDGRRSGLWVDGNGHCSTVDSVGSSMGFSGSPMGDGTRRIAPVVRLVATPGRVKSDRRRVNENRWLPTKKWVLEEVASPMWVS